jgi:hypothetical protein
MIIFFRIAVHTTYKLVQLRIEEKASIVFNINCIHSDLYDNIVYGMRLYNYNTL